MSKDYPHAMHTAEHILSGTMVKMYNCGRPVTTHLERKKSKVDFIFERNLEPAEVAQLEATVNEVIARNLAVMEDLVPQDEAARSFDLSRLPENSGDAVRIVRVGDYDACPCIGGHVSSTSEIGTFRIISTSHENGLLRIRFKV
jgi:misacylated tRNA(Ala) deacylase